MFQVTPEYFSEKGVRLFRKLLWAFGCLLTRGAFDLDGVLFAIQDELDSGFATTRATEPVCLCQFAELVQRDQLKPAEMCPD